MKPLKTLGVFLAIPFIAWLPARFWTVCGEPWCLKIFPEWSDRVLYAIASPYLDGDMIRAAEQMDFLEVWISTVIILVIITVSLFTLLQHKLNEFD